MHLQNHLNIDFGSFSRRFGIDLMLRVESGWILAVPGSIFHGFCLNFGLICEWVERGVCKQSPNEQNALISAMTLPLLLSLGFFRIAIWCGGLRTAHPPPPKGARRA